MVQNCGARKSSVILVTKGGGHAAASLGVYDSRLGAISLTANYDTAKASSGSLAENIVGKRIRLPMVKIFFGQILILMERSNIPIDLKANL